MASIPLDSVNKTAKTNMPDALEAAVTLVEVDLEGELAAVGIIVTGSVITVADARHLLRR